ncbi:hypothetical protein, partial [Burkholderia cenocepacia]|uniref:hypothetical protein n=1 Tax=Burkholderia cenocepacia TaxID=95486 RepID=UPI001C2E65B1
IYAAPAVPTFNCLWDIAHIDDASELVRQLRNAVGAAAPLARFGNPAPPSACALNTDTRRTRRW